MDRTNINKSNSSRADGFSSLYDSVLSSLRAASAPAYEAAVRAIDTFPSVGEFDPSQISEILRLKAICHSKLSQPLEAHNSFSSAAQVCGSHSKTWVSWAQYCYDRLTSANTGGNNNNNGTANGKVKDKDKNTEDPIEKENCKLTNSVITCILKGVACRSEAACMLLARAISLAESSEEKADKDKEKEKDKDKDGKSKDKDKNHKSDSSERERDRDRDRDETTSQ